MAASSSLPPRGVALEVRYFRLISLACFVWQLLHRLGVRAVLGSAWTLERQLRKLCVLEC